MRRCLICLAVLVPLLSYAGEKRGLPRILLAAKYVYVTDIRGNEPTAFGMDSDDRRILAALEQKLQQWGRYSITLRPENADLIIVVRKGRLAGLTVGGRTRRMPDGSSGAGPVVGTEVGPPDDYLAVHDANRGLESSPLWRATAHQGLRVPDLPLLERFKKEIEETAALDRQKKAP